MRVSSFGFSLSPLQSLCGHPCKIRKKCTPIYTYDIRESPYGYALTNSTGNSFKRVTLPLYSFRTYVTRKYCRFYGLKMTNVNIDVALRVKNEFTLSLHVRRSYPSFFNEHVVVYVDDESTNYRDDVVV